MLQEFLNHQFINVQDEKDLEKLGKASTDIVRRINKKKEKIISYTLTALDPQVSPDNEDIKIVEKDIIKHWRTFKSNAKNTSLTYVRAVMLEALEKISKDLGKANLIWLASSSAIKYYKLGREEDLLSNFLLRLGNKIQREAAKNWIPSSPTNNSVTNQFNIELGKLGKGSVNRSALKNGLVWASGPKGENGEVPYESPNDVWSNSGEPWVHQFVSKASTTIAVEVDKALESQMNSISKSQSEVKSFLDRVGASVTKTQTDLTEKSSYNHKRTELLWWKETAYSNSINESYRTLGEKVLLLVIASDYAEIVPEIYPVNVEYFLREFLRNLQGNENKEMKISDILSELKTNNSQIENILVDYSKESGRVSLLNFVKGYVLGFYKLDEFEDRLGFEAKNKIKLVDFCLWMYRDAQAQKIVLAK